MHKVCLFFFHGEFDNGEVLYYKIPEGFRDGYDPKVWCWKLQKTAYGLKKAAKPFWNKVLHWGTQEVYVIHVYIGN